MNELKRRTCRLCKARRYEKEMALIADDVYVCETTRYAWTSMAKRGGCLDDNKTTIKELKKLYATAARITGYEVKIGIKKLPKSIS